MQLQTGLNPYGLTYHLGLQGNGTPRANPDGRGLEGFLALAVELGAKTIEIFEPWIARLDDADISALKTRLAALGMTPVVSSGLNQGPLDSAFRSAERLDARLIRVCLTLVRGQSTDPGARRAIFVGFAGWIILALEFALGADIVRTAIAPTWDQIGQLAAIAAIRTALNYFLEKEVASREPGVAESPTA